MRRFLLHALLSCLLSFALAACAARTEGDPARTAPQTAPQAERPEAETPQDDSFAAVLTPIAPGFGAATGEPAPAENAGRTFADLVRLARSRQQADLSTLLTPPPAAFMATSHVVLTAERQILHLATGVTAYTRSGDEQRPDRLAVALEDGSIRLFTGDGCTSVSLPDGETAAALTLAEAAPRLACLDTTRRTLRVFDLAACGEVFGVTSESDVTHLALSRGGTYLAVADKARNLFIGPATGPMVLAARLRYEPLALAFTPREGLLMVADQAGWVSLFTAKGETEISPGTAPETSPQATLKDPLETLRVPGGPFTAARFNGPMVRYTLPKRKTQQQAEVRRYDLSRRAFTPAEAASSALALSGGLLTYTPQDGTAAAPPLVRKVRFGPPHARVFHEPHLSLILVEDVDGRSRYYEAASGAPVSAPGSVDRAAFMPVPLDTYWRFDINGARYTLADPVALAQTPEDGEAAALLLCRHLPTSGPEPRRESGYVLFWRPLEQNQAFPVPPARPLLPTRVNLKADAALNYRDIGLSPTQPEAQTPPAAPGATPTQEPMP